MTEIPIVNTAHDPEFHKPRHLHVRKVSTDGYKVFIGLHEIGSVMIEQNKGVVYTFGSRRADMPAAFSVRRMTDMKQQLTERISRDLYMSILEGPTEGAGMPVTDE